MYDVNVLLKNGCTVRLACNNEETAKKMITMWCDNIDSDNLIVADDNSIAVLISEIAAVHISKCAEDNNEQP